MINKQKSKNKSDALSPVLVIMQIVVAADSGGNSWAVLQYDAVPVQAKRIVTVRTHSRMWDVTQGYF